MPRQSSKGIPRHTHEGWERPHRENRVHRDGAAPELHDWSQKATVRAEKKQGKIPTVVARVSEAQEAMVRRHREAIDAIPVEELAGALLAKRNVCGGCRGTLMQPTCSITKRAGDHYHELDDPYTPVCCACRAVRRVSEVQTRTKSAKAPDDAKRQLRKERRLARKAKREAALV